MAEIGFKAKYAWFQTPYTSPQTASQDGFLFSCNYQEVYNV